MYGLLIDVIEKATGSPAAYDNELALPGFHIFLSHKAFGKPSAARHFDLQYESISWAYNSVDYERPLSFTAAITLPQSDG